MPNKLEPVRGATINPHKNLLKVDENTFPLISKILKLLMFIPATTATLERAQS